MSTTAKVQRRGLPRRPGGDPWPEVEAVAAAVAAPAGKPGASGPDTGHPTLHQAAAAPTGTHESPQGAGPVAAAHVQLRRGLPRSPDGDRWPGAAPVASPATVATEAEAPASASTVEARPESPVLELPGDVRAETRQIRQGLPRKSGADRWPLMSEVCVQAQIVPEKPAATAAPVLNPPEKPAATAAPVLNLPSTSVDPAPAGRGSSTAPRKPRLSKRWVTTGLAAAALVVFAAVAVGVSRWFLSSNAGVSFLGAYPGEYHLPEGAPVGLPAWLGWQHFMNVFLMVLIIRSGLQIRRETRPAAYWTPKGRKGAKVSLTVWFHQSLDLLWLVNGAVFIVLLFTTGQWMRVIPTSWEVFPNAVSAGLQYMSLDWPTDNGWVNYNSLQQLAYFATIFIAAPLAAATGFRMSGLWPKAAPRMGRWFPVEAARKVHFPVMLYFVAFISVHVILVFATGALRNLNHMYAAQGSIEPTEYASNWTGFWLLVLSLAVIGAAVAASKPFILAPVASLFGKVSSR